MQCGHSALTNKLSGHSNYTADLIFIDSNKYYAFDKQSNNAIVVITFYEENEVTCYLITTDEAS